MAQRETCSALSRICHKTLADNRAPLTARNCFSHASDFGQLA